MRVDRVPWSSRSSVGPPAETKQYSGDRLYERIRDTRMVTEFELLHSVIICHDYRRQ